MMDLPSLLHTQDEYLTQMQDMLEEEFSLLKQHQAHALPALTERKQRLLAAIEGLDKTLAKMPELAQQLTTYSDEVAHLRAKLGACQTQNDINGRLLEVSIVSNRRLATFLHQQRDHSSLTYDAKGNTRSGTRTNGIKA